MDKLKNLNIEKFSDVSRVAEKSLLCSSKKQAKIYLKYWKLYDDAIKRNNSPGYQGFPSQFVPAVQHFNGIVGEAPWYENTVLNWLIAFAISFLVAFIAYKFGW